MNHYTVGELAKNPRSIRVSSVNKQIKRNFESQQADFLDYHEENLDYNLVTAMIRLLGSSILVNDPQVASLLTIQAKMQKKLSPEFKTNLDKYLAATENKQLSSLTDETFKYASYLAPYVLSFRTGKVVENSVCPNSITMAHIREMLKRTADLFDSIGWPQATNITARSKNQVIEGMMDCLVGDSLIEISASPMKNVPSRVIREVLFYYYILDEPHKSKIKKLCLFNPRWNLLNQSKVADLDPELLQSAKDKIDHLDDLMSLSLADRLK